MQRRALERVLCVEATVSKAMHRLVDELVVLLGAHRKKKRIFSPLYLFLQ